MSLNRFPDIFMDYCSKLSTVSLMLNPHDPCMCTYFLVQLASWANSITGQKLSGRVLTSVTQSRTDL